MDGWISTCSAQNLYALQSDSRALACSQLPFEGGLYRFLRGLYRSVRGNLGS